MCEDTRACAGGGDGPAARGTRACAEGLARLWRPQDGRLLTWKKKGGSAASPVSIAMFLTQSTVSARSARPSLHPASVRRRAEALRRAASQCHGPWDGPWLIDLGRLGKGQAAGEKGCGKRQATYYEHTQTCTCGHVCVALCFFVAVLMCLCLLDICVFLFAFLCLVVCLFVCLCCVFGCCVLCGFCLLHASVRFACALLSWAEQ